MKIKKIATVVTGGVGIYLEDINDTQWVGDGCAMYQLGNVPYMKKNNVFALFDIDRKKEEGFACYHNTISIFEDMVADNDHNDEPVKETRVEVRMDGKSVTGLCGSRDMTLIKTVYLKPLGDLEQPTFWKRTNKDGMKSIVVKEGMFTVAIILPNQLGAMGDIYVEMLERITKEVRHNREMAEYETHVQGQLSLIDSDEE